jgi:hypothetical protein
LTKASQRGTVFTIIKICSILAKRKCGVGSIGFSLKNKDCLGKIHLTIFREATKMDDQSVSKNMTPVKRPTWQIVAMIIFCIIGFLFAMPCLCPEGAVEGTFKLMFFMLVMARLLFGFYRNNLSKVDFVVWIGMFLIFCFGIEIL